MVLNTKDYENEREINRLKKLQNKIRKMEDPLEDVWRPMA